jgi:cysteine sulfinate desulfinase/cysteine desulfurase-like protein
MTRKKIADFFLSSPEDILCLLFRLLKQYLQLLFPADRDVDSFFITTSIEHSAVIRNITPLPAHRYHILKVSADGRIDISELSSVLSKNRGRKIRIVYSPVNHETGGIQPVKEIYEKAKNFGAVIIFDAVQTAARLLQVNG